MQAGIRQFHTVRQKKLHGAAAEGGDHEAEGDLH